MFLLLFSYSDKSKWSLPLHVFFSVLHLECPETRDMIVSRKKKKKKEAFSSCSTELKRKMEIIIITSDRAL